MTFPAHDRSSTEALLAAKDAEIARREADRFERVKEKIALQAKITALQRDEAHIMKQYQRVSDENAALREALLAAQKAMRPFEWASQYVDHRLVGEPMVKQFKVAVGKLTVGNFNELAIAVTQTRAALEISGGRSSDT